MLPYRQIHLDFHTSESVPSVGNRFSKENFENALKQGHVNSITLFSKCHHGWSYHPTSANKMHPKLDFDLLTAQIEVCEGLGVRREIYISAGFDEKYAKEHKDHVVLDRNGNSAPFDAPGYHRLCFNTPYLDALCGQIEEVMQLYGGRFSGLFLDIIAAVPCCCDTCRAKMEKEGIDINDFAAVTEYAKKVYQNYCDRVEDAVRKYDKDLPIIHNDGGAIFQGRKVAFRNTGHFELESLPTGGWGYDHFPRAAAYARTLGKEFLGMTGKFHNTWGEFGGYKHPNALRYEAALSNACGAKCSVGDQLHPDGEMDLATYRLIGHAYEEVEKREEYMKNSTLTADIGLLSAEAAANSPYSADFDCANMLSGGINQDLGANRIMLEGHYLYNIIDPEEELEKYKLVILPDNIALKGRFKEKVRNYVKNGGKLLLTGTSGLDETGAFAIDFGVSYIGKGEYRPSYLHPEYSMYPNGKTCYVMYGENHRIKTADDFMGEITLTEKDPYFNRTAEHFCSHQHTPYDRESHSPAGVVTKNVGYIAYDIFTEYATVGSVHLKYAVLDMINALVKDERTLETTLPSQGIVSLAQQETENGQRQIVHLLYAVPKVRGKNTEIIEDIPAIYATEVTVKRDKAPRRVYTALDKKELAFEYKNGRVKFTVPCFECSVLLVIE